MFGLKSVIITKVALYLIKLLEVITIIKLKKNKRLQLEL
jgi:hypothetical protein